MLEPQDIQEFQSLMKEHYGVTLSDEDAQEQGERLVSLVELVLRNPNTQENVTNDNAKL